MQTTTDEVGGGRVRLVGPAKGAALVLLLAGLLWQCVHSTELADPRAGDFEAYWMAARLVLTGGNPYSLDEVAAFQGVPPLRNGSVKVAWNPPWALAVMLPFGLFGFPLSRALWFLLMAGVLFASIGVLWQRFGGSTSSRWAAALLCVLFPPALLALWNGQIAPLLLGGIVGFLRCEARGRWWCAGILLGLGALKPHLLCLFWVALALWMVHHRRWQILAGLAVGIGAATAVALSADSGILTLYRQMMAGEPALPPLFMTATTGALLRVLVGEGMAWLQVAPLAVGICWAVLYYRRHHRSWEWGERMPMLLLGSVVVVPYAWPPDFVLLLPALLHAASKVSRAGARVAWQVLALYVPLAAAGFATWFTGVAGVWHAWQPWAVLGAYTIAHRLAAPKQPAGERSPGRSLECSP